MGTVHQAEEHDENMELIESHRKMSKMAERRQSRKMSRRVSSLRRSSTLVRRSMSVTSIADKDAQRIEDDFDEEELEEPSVWKIIKMNAPEWPLLTVGTIGAAVSGASMPVFAFFYSEIFKTFTKAGANLQSAATLWSCMFVVLAIATGVSMYFRVVGLALAGERLTLRLRVLGFKNILRQSVGWFDDEINAGGRITTRLARDAPIVKQAAGHRVGLLLSAIVTMVAALSIAFAYSWKLALVIVSGFPLLVASGFVELRMKRGGQAIDDELMEEAGRIASECLANVRTVQALVQEKTFYKNYMSNLQPAYLEAKKQAYVYGIVFAFSEAVMLFLYAAAYKYGGYLVEIHDTDPVSVYRVFFAISFCAVAVGQTMGFLPDYMKAKMAAGLMFRLMEMDPEIDNLSSAGEKPAIRGKVTFQDVHFRYPMRPNIRILRGLSFTLEPGHSLALVGPSGCGKSTSIALLERFYDPKRGVVMVDDYDIRKLSLTHLRSHMGLVTQEPVLFDCSIRDNIAYGEYEDVVEEDIVRAAKVANIHDFICGLPKGYDTMVGERGTQLSGGQKQRIAIARALIRDPKILLLDEATSALDTENEKIVQEALDQAMKGRTTIIIAHRLTTIRNADCIAVVDKGVITEMGTHQELVNKRGLYYRLTKRQQLTN